MSAEGYIDGVPCPDCGKVIRGGDARMALHLRVAHPCPANDDGECSTECWEGGHRDVEP